MILTWFLKIIIYPLSFLPIAVLHFIGKIIAWDLQYLLCYRKKVVFNNLAIAFPEKTLKERKKIAYNFYQYLGQLFVEGIKSFSISEEEAEKRCQVLNPQELDKYYEKEKNVIMVFGHYNNWEWPALGGNRQIKHRVAAIFKPTKNEALNQWIKENRTRMGALLMSMAETKDIYENPPKELFANSFIADQKPRNPKKGHWVDFFGRKTCFLDGVSRYAKKYNLPIVFVDIQQPKKGYYTFKIETLVANPKEWNTIDMTQAFATRLEQQIIQNPAYWLWSHKRWKHKYEDYH